MNPTASTNLIDNTENNNQNETDFTHPTASRNIIGSNTSTFQTNSGIFSSNSSTLALVEAIVSSPTNSVSNAQKALLLSQILSQSSSLLKSNSSQLPLNGATQTESSRASENASPSLKTVTITSAPTSKASMMTVSAGGIGGSKHALRQQARRRKRNSIAAGNMPPITRITMKSLTPSPTPQKTSGSPLHNNSSTTQSSSTFVPTPSNSPTIASVVVSSPLSPNSPNSPLQSCSSQTLLSPQSSPLAINTSSGYTQISSDNYHNLDPFNSDLSSIVNSAISSVVTTSLGENFKNTRPSSTNSSKKIINSISCNNNIKTYSNTFSKLKLNKTPPISKLVTENKINNEKNANLRRAPQRCSSRLATVTSTSPHSSPNYINTHLILPTSDHTTTAIPNSATNACTSVVNSNTAACSRNLRVPLGQGSPSQTATHTTIQAYLAAIPGFKSRKKSGRKLSTTAQLAQSKEGKIDLETPDSILCGVNLRSILNFHSFSTLSSDQKSRLMQLLPSIDLELAQDGNISKLAPGSLNNEFFGRACESWRCRLSAAEFTPESQMKMKAEAEKDRMKLDPWKIAHFEPVWGTKQTASNVLSAKNSLQELAVGQYINRSNDSQMLKKESKLLHFLNQLARPIEEEVKLKQLTETKEETEVINISPDSSDSEAISEIKYVSKKEQSDIPNEIINNMTINTTIEVNKNKRKMSSFDQSNSSPSSPNKKLCWINSDSRGTLLNSDVHMKLKSLSCSSASSHIINLNSSNSVTLTKSKMSSESVSLNSGDCTITKVSSSRGATTHPVLRSTAARQLANTVTIQPSTSRQVTRSASKILRSSVVDSNEHCAPDVAEASSSDEVATVEDSTYKRECAQPTETDVRTDSSEVQSMPQVTIHPVDQKGAVASSPLSLSSVMPARSIVASVDPSLQQPPSPSNVVFIRKVAPNPVAVNIASPQSIQPQPVTIIRPSSSLIPAASIASQPIFLRGVQFVRLPSSNGSSVSMLDGTGITTTIVDSAGNIIGHQTRTPSTPPRASSVPLNQSTISVMSPRPNSVGPPQILLQTSPTHLQPSPSHVSPILSPTLSQPIQLIQTPQNVQFLAPVSNAVRSPEQFNTAGMSSPQHLPETFIATIDGKHFLSEGDPNPDNDGRTSSNITAQTPQEAERVAGQDIECIESTEEETREGNGSRHIGLHLRLKNNRLTLYQENGEMKHVELTQNAEEEEEEEVEDDDDEEEEEDDELIDELEEMEEYVEESEEEEYEVEDYEDYLTEQEQLKLKLLQEQQLQLERQIEHQQQLRQQKQKQQEQLQYLGDPDEDEFDSNENETELAIGRRERTTSEKKKFEVYDLEEYEEDSELTKSQSNENDHEVVEINDDEEIINRREEDVPNSSSLGGNTECNGKIITNADSTDMVTKDDTPLEQLDLEDNEDLGSIQNIDDCLSLGNSQDTNLTSLEDYPSNIDSFNINSPLVDQIDELASVIEETSMPASDITDPLKDSSNAEETKSIGNQHETSEIASPSQNSSLNEGDESIKESNATSEIVEETSPNYQIEEKTPIEVVETNIKTADAINVNTHLYHQQQTIYNENNNLQDVNNCMIPNNMLRSNNMNMMMPAQQNGGNNRFPPVLFNMQQQQFMFMNQNNMEAMRMNNQRFMNVNMMPNMTDAGGEHTKFSNMNGGNGMNKFISVQQREDFHKFRSDNTDSESALAMSGENDDKKQQSDDDSPVDDGCPCKMKAMIVCLKCGAFCHYDCITPARICGMCMVR